MQLSERLFVYTCWKSVAIVMVGNIDQRLYGRMQEVPNTICYSLFVNLSMGEFSICPEFVTEKEEELGTKMFY